MRMSYYAGIGSRETPGDILNLIVAVAKKLADNGDILRSGHAPGADQAFEFGAAGKAQIFLPWPAFEASTPVQGQLFNNPSESAFAIAAEFHPAWNRLSDGAKRLMARNAHQVLGPSLDDPVDFILCWTEGGKLKGGTAQALRMAQEYDIPINNLGNEACLNIARQYLED